MMPALKHLVLSLTLPLSISISAQTFETASEAVSNMGIGWNLGNTLESNSGDTTNMWIEQWTARTPSDYENAWGQRPATRELIHMMKEAGFRAIRVPVSWYPHMGITLSAQCLWKPSEWQPTAVDSVWMERVAEVVGYVLDEGLYCILNVHHDTGAANTAWLRASGRGYAVAEETFRQLWTQIATRFQDADEHLIFEAYNEMLDDYSSWCFASFAAPGNYNATAAADTYQAINQYAATFVETVRATGGNNAQRNLMINTYGACSGHGTWSSHLAEPLTQLILPTDPFGTQEHLMVSVHSYPSLRNNNAFISRTQMEQQNQQQIQVIVKQLQQAKQVPVVIGEWGSSEGTDYNDNRQLYLQFVQDFTTRALAAGLCPMYWMGISDGEDRAVPAITQPDVLQAMFASTAVDNTPSVPQVQRIFTNGQILILRNGALYTLTGIRIN